MYVFRMDQLTKDDITAAAAAHQELGPHFDGAVAESLVERIGAEIDKRVDARVGDMGGRRSRPARRPPATGSGTQLTWPATVLALGSMGLGIGATAVILNTNGGGGPESGQIFLALVLWIILGAINISHARRR
jgi:hypothetical protein